MKLFELLETESENVVIQRAGCAAKQSLELDIAARCVAVIDGDRTAHVLPCLAFNPDRTSVNGDIEPATVRSAIQRLIAARLPSTIEPEQNGSDERHERALPCFIGAMKNVQPRR